MSRHGLLLNDNIRTRLSYSPQGSTLSIDSIMAEIVKSDQKHEGVVEHLEEGVKSEVELVGVNEEHVRIINQAAEDELGLKGVPATRISQQGDPTYSSQGRLSFDPTAHILVCDGLLGQEQH